VAWNPLNQGDIKIAESIQRRYTKKLRGLGSLSYNQRLASLSTLSSESACLYNDLIFAFKVIHGHVPFKPCDFGFQLSEHS
jgi:hypothetical protein